MKTILKCALIAVLALLVSGFMKSSRDLYPKTIYHVVEPNQTFWEVCTMYSGFDKKYQTLSEFVYETRKINGGKIIYMPGEKIKIIVWQMKEGKIDYGTNSKH